MMIRRRTALGALGVGLTGLPAWPASAERSLKICIARDAGPRLTRLAQEIAAAAHRHPLLSVMGPASVYDSAHPAPLYDHLVLIGIADDPLIRAAWQRDARLTADRIYVFGFGHFTGDIGYIESDRSPFLHSSAVASAPFEAEVVTITGTTVIGIELAVRAFLESALVNGVIAAPGWSRPKPTLLDRDPLEPGFALPPWVPEKIGSRRRIAITQASEDEYRGVLADGGVSPREIWRIKYFEPGAWDGAGAAKALDNYQAGLHRRSFGNTLWIARFGSADEAAGAAARIPAKVTQGGEWLQMSTVTV